MPDGPMFGEWEEDVRRKQLPRDPESLEEALRLLASLTDDVADDLMDARQRVERAESRLVRLSQLVRELAAKIGMGTDSNG